MVFCEIRKDMEDYHKGIFLGIDSTGQEMRGIGYLLVLSALPGMTEISPPQVDVRCLTAETVHIY